MSANGKPVHNAFTIKFSGRVLRIVTDIDVAPVFDATLAPVPPGLFTRARALWDTGATNSHLTQSFANAMGLVPTGMATVNHAGGRSQVRTFLVNFALPNKVLVPGVAVAECDDGAGQFGVIIGMDIMGIGDLSISNVNGATMMSFRIPSVAGIDYVIETNRMLFSGANRNAPCPCGEKWPDGKPKKYKECHGKTV